MQNITVKGVKIGDMFRPNNSKHLIAKVVDFIECRSMVTGEITGTICAAQLINGLAKNTFETPFSSVIRYKIIKEEKVN